MSIYIYIYMSHTKPFKEPRFCHPCVIADDEAMIVRNFYVVLEQFLT